VATLNNVTIQNAELLGAPACAAVGAYTSGNAQLNNVCSVALSDCATSSRARDTATVQPTRGKRTFAGGELGAGQPKGFNQLWRVRDTVHRLCGHWEVLFGGF
jgi:hypothetical protein